MPSDKSGDPRQGADRSAIRSTRPGLSIAASVPGHKTAPMVPGLVLVDAWRYADPMSPGWTWDRPNPYVAATGEPSARIDNVLVGLPRPLAPIRVESVRLIGDQPPGWHLASDHAGVLAEFQPATLRIDRCWRSRANRRQS
jgi:hypothetical protein